MPEQDDPYAEERARWRSRKRERPAEIVRPGPGQVSVWDFPRPPRVEPVAARVRVEFGGRVIADSTRALRVCETASPPAYYLPPQDVAQDCLEPSERTTFCEWKGVARYWTLRVGKRRAKDAAWSYPNPDAGYEAIRDHLAFYPGRVDACWVGEHRVAPQPGRYYGGWVTPELVGPFKGAPGTESW
jgi:uncharacterized protein (DUF427 family)